ncbi:MAG: Transposase IS116/IS110/IS902 family protein [Methanosaeta sp. PtaU1.Bin055]|jgi:transposase|nr:MAG: Transposase IS116/IS110/IS902 family protein [Methanosaeta sp. PtaU1.Bin055]
MDQRRYNVCCGADIHKKFLVATILFLDGTKLTKRFSMDLRSLFEFRDWINANGCEAIAVESTGSYWVPIYRVLEGHVELIVANAYKIKNVPGRKTDTVDSEWIAELCRNGQIRPSRIFPKDVRDLRNLTRARERYVDDKTRVKNRIHHILDSNCIRLSSVLSNIFGKSGRYILNCILEGMDVDEIIEGIPVKRIEKKEDQIREALTIKLSCTDIILIRGYLDQIDSIQKNIDELESEIRKRIAPLRKDMAIVMSVPGIGFISAVVILAEIGNYNDFNKAEQLAAWCGLVPSVYQSADKIYMGSITKQGSGHIRRILVEVAHVVARTKGRSKLKSFFLRIKAKKGTNIAAVALARKVLCVLHHLLTVQEMYQEEEKDGDAELEDPNIPRQRISLDDMIRRVIKAGYEVQKREPGAGG